MDFTELCVKETLKKIRGKSLYSELPITATPRDSVRRSASGDYDHALAYILAGKKTTFLTLQKTITLSDEPASLAEEYCAIIARALSSRAPRLYAVLPQETSITINYKIRVV